MSTDRSIPSDDFQASPDTGVRLKLLRELAGISQRELAKRAGMTNSSISTIEQGQVSPSVQSLARILSAIPITLSDFFSFSHESIASGTSGTQMPRVKQQTLVLPAQSSSAFLVAPAELSGVVLNGSLMLILPQGKQTLMHGQSFCIPAGQLFRFSNLTTEELRFYICSLFELSI